jgi:hypothetical protein
MGAIVIRTRFDEGTESAEVATSENKWCLPEISKMKYRNRIPEPGTTISGFADSLKK